MNKTFSGGALRRSAAVLACTWLTAAPALAANESRALKPGDEYLTVVNYPNNLNVVDLQSNSVYKTCALPGAFGPAVINISPDKRNAFILNDRFAAIYGIELDSCKVMFKADLSPGEGERAKSIFSFTLSADGKEAYAVINPTTIGRDHYRVGEPRFIVFDTSAGLTAKPIRSFPAPRQSNIMLPGDDGSVYLAGQNLYKINPRNGDTRITLPIRDWERPTHAPLDLLYFWPVQTPQKDFTILYTTARYQDDKQDLDTAEFQYGFLNVNLATGEAEAREFAPLVEVYFTGLRSPKDRNIIYGLLHRLTKYDISTQQLVKAVEPDHTYYTLLGNRDGSRLYLTGTLNDIAVHDADSLEKLTNIVLPGGDMSLGTGQVFVR